MTGLPGRLVRATRAAAGLALTGTVLGGPPYALVRFIGWPLPRHAPTWPALRAFLASPLSDDAIISGLACVVWLLWAVVVSSLVIEAAAAASGRPARRLPVIGPFQAAAALLIAAILAASQAPRAIPSAAPSLRAALTASTATTAAEAAAQRASPRAPEPTAVSEAAAPAADSRAGPARWPRVYRVAEGDNLWDIAARYLGDGERWHELYQLNVGKPQPDGLALTDPDLIYPGWILLMPPQPVGPASTGPASDGPRRSAEHSPPAPHGSRHPGRLVAPAGTSARQHDCPAAVRLPSGALIGISVAMMVAAALTLARIQRRRRYRPRLGPPGRPPPAEPPLPAVIAALHHAASPPPSDAGADDDGGGGPDPAGSAWPDTYLDLYDTTDPGSEHNGEPAGAGLAREAGPAGQSAASASAPGAAPPSARPPGAIPVGVRGASEAVIDIAALGGLGLVGPGALAAARALLATLLAQATPAVGGAPPAIIIPAGDAAGLLPGEDLAGVMGASVPASLNAALDEMEAALLRHARTAGRAGPGDDPLTMVGDAGPFTTLIATCGPEAARRLGGILDSGRHLGTAAIILGPWQPGVTCQVAADGVVTAVMPPTAALEGIQLFHLGAADTAAITAVLSEARGAPPASPPPAAPPEADPPARRAPQHPPGSQPAPDGRPAAVADAAAPPGPARAGGPAPATERPVRVPAPPGAGADAAGNGQAAPPGSGRPVQLTVLGPPRITAAGKEIGGGLRKARELLAFLAVHPDGASGEAISEALWPEADPGHAAAQRNLALRKTRDMLRSATGLTVPIWIINASGRYRLDPNLIAADMWQFTAALDEARHADDEDARLAACQKAVGLYRGELTEGQGYEWAEPHAENARRRALDAWTTIAEILQPRDPDQALAALEAALGHDPYNEFLYQRIMRLQAAAGRPEAVRRTLRLLEAMLTDLGITPASQTRQVAATLLGTPGPAPQQQRQPPAPAPSGHGGEQRGTR